MSKAVMLSIRPKWCEKIANGEKTIEVRKTRPKLKTPFKCYIYCTLPKYPHEDFIATNYPRPQFYGGGKVVGEFTCDLIYELETRSPGGSYYVKGQGQPTTNDVARQSCLTLKDMHKYLQSEVGYGWHISGLLIYDQPRELTAFRRACKNSWYCESCAMYWENNGTCGNESLQIRRPPQSWCYVEAMDGERKDDGDG